MITWDELRTGQKAVQDIPVDPATGHRWFLRGAAVQCIACLGTTLHRDAPCRGPAHRKAAP